MKFDSKPKNFLSVKKIESIQEAPPHTLEKDCKVIMSDTLKAFKEHKKYENDKFMNTVDSEFWACLVFPTRELKDEFLEKSGFLKHGDKYLNGLKIAELMNIPLNYERPKEPKFRINKKLLPFLRSS